MRIAQLAPLNESVPPALHGCVERVVAWLCDELIRRGHDVTLFASGDSSCAARLVPVVDRALRLSFPSPVDPVALHLLAIRSLEDRLAEFDLVHSHLDYLTFQSLSRAAVPVVTTLHGRLDVRGLRELYGCYAAMPLVSVSNSQREPIPEANWLATVYYGLPVEQYAEGKGAGDYFVFLGRLAPEKRPHVAIEVARRAGVRLVIAAKVDATDQAYFEQAVEPWLDDPLIEFVGEITEGEKAELLGNAKGLLSPILWPEPFCLSMVEAMVYGTPVITRRCGSVPEVIAHGEVGYLCDDDDALVDAVKQIDRIDRGRCRRWVEERFSAARMADDYEAVYGSLLKG